MSVIERATREFARLPGIGQKTALRLVYHLLKSGSERSQDLARALVDLAERIHPCTRCGNFSEGELCEVCSNPRREPGTLCVVEEAFDVAAVERTGAFRGRYHVLGGRLSPLDGIGPDELNLAGLLARIRDEGEGRDEVIVATNASMEGEATAVLVESQLRPWVGRITRLARGIPMGSDLEYVDGTTLAQALSGRREMQ
ncbi:MAG: recombination mediator RecR [Gemmatimonadota bacterium]